jgi:hypothetical protein
MALWASLATPSPYCPCTHEEAMRAETESVVNEIKESLSLLRRHL